MRSVYELYAVPGCLGFFCAQTLHNYCKRIKSPRTRQYVRGRGFILQGLKNEQRNYFGQRVFWG